MATGSSGNCPMIAPWAICTNSSHRLMMRGWKGFTKPLSNRSQRSSPAFSNGRMAPACLITRYIFSGGSEASPAIFRQKSSSPYRSTTIIGSLRQPTARAGPTAGASSDRSLAGAVPMPSNSIAMVVARSHRSKLHAPCPHSHNASRQSSTGSMPVFHAMESSTAVTPSWRVLWRASSAHNSPGYPTRANSNFMPVLGRMVRRLMGSGLKPAGMVRL